jgi:exodeoxyribonuclease V alpha subunit
MINNYDKGVFNGDLGWITAIDLEVSEVTITFDGQAHPYAFHELDEIQLAYAISIHKSQGSEFPMVVIPVVMQHYTLLARNLLYTGITRGKQRVILLGQKKSSGNGRAQPQSAKTLNGFISALRGWFVELN